MILLNPLSFVYFIVILFFLAIILDSLNIKSPFVITGWFGILLIIIGLSSPLFIANINNIFFEKQQQTLCSFLKLDIDRCQLNYSTGLYNNFRLEVIVSKKIEGDCLIERFSLKKQAFELNKKPETCKKLLILSLMNQDYSNYFVLTDSDDVEINLNKNKVLIKQKVDEFIQDSGEKI